MAGFWCPHRFLRVWKKSSPNIGWLSTPIKTSKSHRFGDPKYHVDRLGGLKKSNVQCHFPDDIAWPENLRQFLLPFKTLRQINCTQVKTMPRSLRWKGCSDVGFFRHLQRSRCNSRTLLRWTLDLQDFPSMLISSWGSGISRSMSGWLYKWKHFRKPPTRQQVLFAQRTPNRTRHVLCWSGLANTSNGLQGRCWRNTTKALEAPSLEV